MEGPSLHLAAEQLQPFAGRRIESVSGNSRIGIERLTGLKVSEIFAWGKHLVFQFDTFALRGQVTTGVPVLHGSSDIPNRRLRPSSPTPERFRSGFSS